MDCEKANESEVVGELKRKHDIGVGSCGSKLHVSYDLFANDCHVCVRVD